MNNEQTKRPSARKDRLVVRRAQDEVLVYDLDTNKAHCLNDAAARIWNYCDGERTVADIGRCVSADIGSDVEENAVWYALATLEKSKLLQEPVVPSELLHQAGRRDAVRRLGLATIIAVPLVTSIMAPTPAQAASCPANECMPP